MSNIVLNVQQCDATKAKYLFYRWVTKKNNELKAVNQNKATPHNTITPNSIPTTIGTQTRNLTLLLLHGKYFFAAANIAAPLCYRCYI